MRLHDKVAIINGSGSGFGEGTANAALFLASDDASFITSACPEVDGGRCIQSFTFSGWSP